MARQRIRISGLAALGVKKILMKQARKSSDAGSKKIIISPGEKISEKSIRKRKT